MKIDEFSYEWQSCSEGCPKNGEIRLGNAFGGHLLLAQDFGWKPKNQKLAQEMDRYRENEDCLSSDHVWVIGLEEAKSFADALEKSLSASRWNNLPPNFREEICKFVKQLIADCRNGLSNPFGSNSASGTYKEPTRNKGLDKMDSAFKSENFGESKHVTLNGNFWGYVFNVAQAYGWTGNPDFRQVEAVESPHHGGEWELTFGEAYEADLAVKKALTDPGWTDMPLEKRKELELARDVFQEIRQYVEGPSAG